MNKYFSKALFFTEKKNMISATVAYGLVYVIGIFIMIGGLVGVSNGTFYIPPSPVNILNICYFFFIVFALTSVLQAYTEKDKKYNFMLTQPYKRDAIIITKTISFILPYLITTIIYGIVCIILVLINKNYYMVGVFGNSMGTLYQESTSGLLLKLLGIIVILTFITVLTQLLQMFFGKTAAGALFPIGIYLMLFASFNLGVSFMSKRLGFIRTTFDYITDFLFSLTVRMDGNLVFKSLLAIILDYLAGPSILGSLLILIISALLLWVTILLNRKIKAENTSDIFMFKASEKIFNIVVALTFTIIGSQIAAGIIYNLYGEIKGIQFSTYLIRTYGLGGKEAIEQNIYLVLNILWIPIFVLVYKGFSKLMNKRRAV